MSNPQQEQFLKHVSAEKVISLVIIMTCVLAVIAVVCAALGPHLSFDYSFDKIFSWKSDNQIIFGERIPRVLCAIIAGGALALAGLIYQGLLRNPLADPFILGVSGGAAFGAVLAIFIGGPLGYILRPVFGFGGAVGAMALVYAFSSKKGRVGVYTLILSGVIVNSLFSAMILFTINFLKAESLQTYMYWMMGRLQPGENVLYIMAGVILPACVLVYFLGRKLNLLSMGEDDAAALGVDVEKTKKFAFVLASLITGVVVSFTGAIGFVGLIVPHAVRMTIGSDHRLLIPASFFSGAIFLVIADTIGRSFFSFNFPVGVITSFCGAPFFIWIMRRQQNRKLM